MLLVDPCDPDLSSLEIACYVVRTFLNGRCPSCNLTGTDARLNGVPDNGLWDVGRTIAPSSHCPCYNAPPLYIDSTSKKPSPAETKRQSAPLYHVTIVSFSFECSIRCAAFTTFTACYLRLFRVFPFRHLIECFIFAKEIVCRSDTVTTNEQISCSIAKVGRYT